MTAGPPRVALVHPLEEEFLSLLAMLRQAGADHRFAIDWLSSYNAALASLQSGHHDVYLVGHRLGDRTGLDLVRHAAALGLHAPIVLLTEGGDRTIDAQAMEAGAADCLDRETVVQESLERAMRHALDRGHVLDRLRRSEERFRAMVEHSTEVLLTVDDHGVVLYASPPLERVLGYRPEDYVGRSGFELVHPEDLVALRQGYARCLERPGEPVTLDIRARHRDGRTGASK
ncbi:MAG: PAS domain S-box protein [Myxococcaceae bacterium]|nr:PAS domain S-box protein [Myxococcaceae bacterium]